MPNKKVKTTIVIQKDEIDNYEAEADAFLNKILNIKSALYTDLTQISDFSCSGLTTAQYDAIKDLEYKEILNRWDAIILQKIQDVYGVKLNTTQYLLLDFIKDLEAQKVKTLH